VLFGGVAVVNLALELRTQKRRIDQDDAADGSAGPAGHQGRRHPAHRMPEEDRGGQSQFAHEGRDIARVIVVAIAVKRCARFAVPSGIRHHHIECIFEQPRQGAPAGPAAAQSMQQNHGRLAAARPQVMDVDAA